MRVLYLCHRIPYPPNKGEKIRAFHQLKAIGARHEVDLFTLIDDVADMAHQPELARYCRQVTVSHLNPRIARLSAIPFLLSRTALTLPYFYSQELDINIRKAVIKRSYDRIFVYCSAMAQYVEWIDQIPIVTDLVDVDSDKWIQYAAHTSFPFSAVYRREGHCLREYERRVCAASSAVVVTTHREKDLVVQIDKDANVHVIANGVDTEYFKPVQVRPDPPALAIIFTGDMRYFPNQEAVIYFARKILPLIQQSVAGVQFLIVGRNPSRDVQELQKLNGVQVTGFVPDVRTYLANARVSVAPFSIAAGIQNKILEAMAYGLPVVATPRAVQGFPASVRSIVETGQNAAEIAEKIVQLLRDPELAHRKGIDGRRQVTADYNWDRLLNQMLQLIENPVRTHTNAHSHIS